MYFTLFSKKEKDGIYKYYENIIVWTIRLEIQLTYDNYLMKDYKEIPKKVLTEDDLKK